MPVTELHQQQTQESGETIYTLKDRGDDGKIIAEVKIRRDIDMNVPRKLSPAFKRFLRSPKVRVGKY